MLYESLDYAQNEKNTPVHVYVHVGHIKAFSSCQACKTNCPYAGYCEVGLQRCWTCRKQYLMLGMGMISYLICLISSTPSVANYYYGSYTHLDARFKKKNTTTARRITVASSVNKFTDDILFKILYINPLKIL